MVSKSLFGTLKIGPFAGREVYLYKIYFPGSPLTITVSDFGAILYDVQFTKNDRKTVSLVRGYETLDFYERANDYMGSVVGRVGNRIKKGRFKLNGNTYNLYKNNMGNHLHGGQYGFNYKVYEAECTDSAHVSLLLKAVSPDGDEGYPGCVSYSVRYTLEKNGFTIEYNADTDKPTPLNLTNHSYFNLNGEGTVLDHVLQLDCDRYIPIDNKLIPTGEICKVSGTALDFNSPRQISEALRTKDENVDLASGIDHCLVFPEDSSYYCKRGSVYSPKSGIYMDFYTDLPAVQVYTGNFLIFDEFPFRGGEPEQKHAAICLESEYLIDSLNHEGFSDIVLNPGNHFYSKTGYYFGQK